MSRRLSGSRPCRLLRCGSRMPSLHDAAAFLVEFCSDKTDSTRSHVARVFEAVSASFGFQIAFEWHAERTEFHSQPVGRIVPAIVGRIAAEELIPRPVEWMNVEERRVLPRVLGVAIHIFEARVDAFVDSFLKIDRGRNRSNGRK